MPSTENNSYVKVTYFEMACPDPLQHHIISSIDEINCLKQKVLYVKEMLGGYKLSKELEGRHTWEMHSYVGQCNSW